MDAPVVVITGANSGIGKAAAIQFAARGWHVVMACRDIARSETARRDVCEEAESPKVDLLELDLASLESVRQFAGEFAASRPYDSYRMYADSKMGQLLLMFASEADFAADHIRTNALMIPATKLTPDRIAKLPPRYRLLARLQQPISHEVRYMASRYVEICTAPDLERLHGVVFNHTLRQLRRPASDQTLGPLEVLRTRHIPVYAVQGAHQVRMREIAEQVCR